MTNINFLLTMSTDGQEIRLWESTKWSPKLRENALIFYQILSTHSLRKYIEISLENLYVDIGTYRVKPTRMTRISDTFLTAEPGQPLTALIYSQWSNVFLGSTLCSTIITIYLSAFWVSTIKNWAFVTLHNSWGEGGGHLPETENIRIQCNPVNVTTVGL